MLRHKTRPKSSSDLGKIKQHVGFISVTVMLHGLQSGLLYKELDGPHWTQSELWPQGEFCLARQKLEGEREKIKSAAKAGVSVHWSSLLLTCGQAADKNLSEVFKQDSPR